MITLEGKNLCERQKDLNLKVKKAAENNVRLQEVKCADHSDIDRIFKIDLASEYKNIEYIIEELKSGDSLYISRALKCKWLYTSEYAHLINPHYLHYYIFPTMSFKMKKKMLTKCSANIKNEIRAEDFYGYCMKYRLTNNAEKFLIFTSGPFKLNVLNNNILSQKLDKDSLYFQHLIGSSFYLANAYAQNELPLVELSYLYSVNEENYLNLLERYPENSRTEYLGVKTSRSVMKNHKDRVLRNVCLYLRYLNPNVVVMYSSCGDAQIYLRAVLPQNEELFWHSNYYTKFKDLIGLLNTVSKFQFIKQIVEEKYGTSDFELNSNFIKFRYFDLMTLEERKTWLLKMLQMQERITKSSAILSEGDNYKWCQFMHFPKSLSLINYQLCKTTERHKRSKMLTVLVQSATTEDDLETLLNYYYNKHIMSEQPIYIAIFLENVIEYHNVFEFNNACWVTFDMIMQNFQLHNWQSNKFPAVSFIYRVINNITLPEHLRQFMHVGENYNHIFAMYLKQLKKEELCLVYDTMNSEIMNQILDFDMQKYCTDYEYREKGLHYLNLFLDCRQFFREFDIDEDYPDIILKFMKLDFKCFKSFLQNKYKNESKLTEGYLLRCLKQDASQIAETLPTIIDKYNASETFQCFRINMLLKKIKIFFSNDIAKQCLVYFTKVLYGELPYNGPIKPLTINGIVFAIFQLGDERSKTELMDKFAPTKPTIELNEMNHNDYITQVAICRFHSYSRPPVPLRRIALYLKEGYLPACKQMLYMHMSNLSRALRTKFFKLLLNSPLPIQKRAIHLVFELTVKIDDLRHAIAEVWNETRNTTLRKKIYVASLKRIRNGDVEICHTQLLEHLTFNVRENDDEGIFCNFGGENITEKFRGHYLELCWKSLAKLPGTDLIHHYRTEVAESILKNRDLMHQEFLHDLIHGEIASRFQRKLPLNVTETEPSYLDIIFTRLQFLYITDIPNNAKLERSLKIVELFTEECFKRWNDDHPTGIFYYQEIYNVFISDILKKPDYFGPKFLRLIYIADKMLENFVNKIGLSEAYSRFWDWKLALITRNAIRGRQECDQIVYCHFGYLLGDFVKQLKEKNCFYISFLDKVFGKISSAIHDMHMKITASMSVEDALVLIAFGLISNEIFETYILALKILPTDLTVSPDCRKTLLSVLRGIKSQNNDELSAFIKEKYNNSEAKSRKLIESFRYK